jgi:hypothetical protein
MIHVTSNKENISQYQSILVSEWKKNLPDAVLSLLWNVVALERPGDGNEPLLALLDPDRPTAFPTNHFRAIVTQIGDATGFVRLPKLPALPIAPYEPPRKMSKSVWVANRLTTYLTLSAHARVEGDLGFFVDVQALAFQAALQFALPEVRERHPAEHSILLHSAALFAIGYSTHEFSHYAYMISRIHDYLGNHDQSLESLYASFRFTSPHDHSFLTKAQAFWSELLDRKKFKEAEEFLFSLHWWSLPTQQEEVREMMVSAFTHILKHGKRPVSA